MVGIAAGHCSDGRLLTIIVVTISIIIPFLFIPVLPLGCIIFSQKECSKPKTYFVKVEGHAEKPRWAFWGLWQPFWIFEVLIEGLIESKTLFSKSLSGGPKTFG